MIRRLQSVVIGSVVLFGRLDVIRRLQGVVIKRVVIGGGEVIRRLQYVVIGSVVMEGGNQPLPQAKFLLHIRYLLVRGSF